MCCDVTWSAPAFLRANEDRVEGKNSGKFHVVLLGLQTPFHCNKHQVTSFLLLRQLWAFCCYCSTFKDEGLAMAQLTECWPRRHKVLGSVPELCIHKVWWHTSVKAALGDGE